MTIQIDEQYLVEHEDVGRFEWIAYELEKNGYCVLENALPVSLTAGLLECVSQISPREFDLAGIGRNQDYSLDLQVRRDRIHWIEGSHPASKHWLDWIEQLRLALNRQLFMGLFDFESHFARYTPGAYYKRHYDAFKGSTNRILSVVTYLNPDWQDPDGGELILYLYDNDTEGVKIMPRMGTLVLFLSEQFPHEVLPALRERLSIAGWFRPNTEELP